MNIINAVWDEKITGLKQCEIVFAQSDTFQTYLDAEIEKIFKFSVVKLPVGNLSLVHQLEDIGYRYLENQLFLSFNVEQLEYLNLKWNRLFTGFTYKQVTSADELKSLTDQVSDKMFEADRYSQDPLGRENFLQKDM